MLVATDGLRTVPFVAANRLRTFAFILPHTLQAFAVLLPPGRSRFRVLCGAFTVIFANAVTPFLTTYPGIVPSLTEFVALQVAAVPAGVKLPVPFLAQGFAWAILRPRLRQCDDRGGQDRQSHNDKFLGLHIILQFRVASRAGLAGRACRHEELTLKNRSVPNQSCKSLLLIRLQIRHECAEFLRHRQCERGLPFRHRPGQ